MHVILQGSLGHFPLGQLLPMLGKHKHSGTLDVEAKGRRARLFVRDGIVICGESPAGSDPPAIVAEFLGDTDATFTFLDEIELPAKAKESKFTADALLREAERRAAIARAFTDDTEFRVVEAPESKQEISIKPEHFRLLFRIGTGRTFGELLAGEATTRADLAASLQELESIGLIARSEPQPAAVAGKRAGALTSADAPPTVYPLVADSYTIGREAGNDIAISHQSVSSRHARITRTADGFVVEDLGSRNGTFVNGEPVRDPVALGDNDTIRIGKLLFTFNLAAQIRPSEQTQTKTSRS